MAAKTLRLATYLSPSFPVEYFETVSHYLEEKLKVCTTLLYESRWPGPPIGLGRPDPFEADAVDIAFMDSISYIQLVDNKNSYLELLPVTSVHSHPKSEGKAGNFADVLVHCDLKECVKEFLDLRGSKWAYSNENSLSGNLITIRTLKAMGEHPSFFGNLLVSGSHVKSIEMIVQKQADAAAVDANCAATYLDKNPWARSEVFCLQSWGPLPPYPVVVNSRMPDSLKKEIVNALLVMNKQSDWSRKLLEHKVTGFAPNQPSSYDTERDMITNIKGLKLGAVYY